MRVSASSWAPRWNCSALPHRHRHEIVRSEDFARIAAFLPKELRDADEALVPLKRVADACVGAFFACETDKEREKERARRLDLLGGWLARAVDGVPPTMPQAVRELSAPGWVFHWALEFPEVFHGKRPDPLDGEQANRAAWMDGFVGNPPFMGGSHLSRRFGNVYLRWVLMTHPGAHGNADLSAHFFRRAFHLLGSHGTIGFIATNTIAQGDTRTAGLKWMVDHGAQLFDAVQSRKWPVPGANVLVSVVHIAKGHVATFSPEPRVDGKRVHCVGDCWNPAATAWDTAPGWTAEMKTFVFGTTLKGHGPAPASPGIHQALSNAAQQALHLFDARSSVLRLVPPRGSPALEGCWLAHPQGHHGGHPHLPPGSKLRRGPSE